MVDWSVIAAKVNWSRIAAYAGIVTRHAVGRALLVLIVLIVNPFGIVTWGDLRSHDIWQTLYASHYQSRDVPRAVAVRNQITVVKLDERDEEQVGPAGEFADSIHYGEVFRFLHSGAHDANGAVKGGHARPRAIFLDLLMGDWAPGDGRSVNDLLGDKGIGDCPKGLGPDKRYAAPKSISPFQCMVHTIADITGYSDNSDKGWRNDGRCTENELAKLLCIIDRGHVPVLIASPVDPANPRSNSANEGVVALSKVAVAVPVFVKDSSYPLANPQRLGDRDNRSWSLTPAAMLYAAYCYNNAACRGNPILPGQQSKAIDTDPNTDGAGWLSRPRWSADFDTPVDVIWATGATDAFTNKVDSLWQRGTMPQKCLVADTRWSTTLLSFVKAFFSGVDLAAVGSGNANGSCIYQHEIGLTDLRLGGTAGPFAADHRAVIDAALTGKIVLVGRAVPASGDFVPAGPHQKLPGVYYHAMALDNLMMRGSGYPKIATRISPYFSLTNDDLWNTIAAAAMLLFGGLVVADDRLRERGTKRIATWRLAGIAGLWLIGTMMWMIGVFYLLTSPMRLIPDQFNLAALSIVIVVEFFKIAGIVLRPILDRLAERSKFVGLLVGPGAVQKVSRQAGRRRAKSGDGVADARGATGAR